MENVINLVIVQYMYIESLQSQHLKKYHDALQMLESAERMIGKIDKCQLTDGILTDIMTLMEKCIEKDKSIIQKYIFEPDVIVVSPDSTSSDEDVHQLDSFELQEEHGDASINVLDDCYSWWLKCKWKIVNFCMPHKFKND